MHTEQSRPVSTSPAPHRALGCAGSSRCHCDACAINSNRSSIYRRLHQSLESQGEVSLDKDNDIPLDELEAEEIIGEEFYDSKPHYWVRWKATREPEINLKTTGNLLAKWKGKKAKVERRSGAAGITKRRGQPRKIPLD